MRVDRLLIIVLSLLTAVPPVRAEISDDQIFDSLIRVIKGQVGDFDTDLWEDARKGGYLLQFAEDIYGDHSEEDFLINSMSLDGTEGNWAVFSGGENIGWVELSGIEFVAIREEDATRLLHIQYSSLHESYVLAQTLSENGVKRERRKVHPDETDGIIEQWKAVGVVIRPKIEAILLADFLRGSREWKAIDLTDFDTVAYLSDASGGRSHIVLRSDEERLSEMDFTAEVALELLESSMRASADGEPDFVHTAEEPSAETAVEKVTKPPPAERKVEEPAPSEDGKVWPWIIGTIVLVIAGGLMLKRRKRS